MSVTPKEMGTAVSAQGRHYTYGPILKGKPGEFDAWRHSDAQVVRRIRPVFEVVPSTHGRDRDLELFVNRLVPAWAETEYVGVATVDTGALDQISTVSGTSHAAVYWTARELHGHGVAVRPVVRLGDPVSVVTEVAAALQLHGAGVCLRLGDERSDPDVATADAGLNPLLQAIGIGVADVHLVIDLWAVASPRDVSRAVHIAEALARWAASVGPWASITLASGAFPESISVLPTGTSTDLPRYDAALWLLLSQIPGLPYTPDFGDYAINHPAMPPLETRSGPHPNLRYTFETDWRVFRERKLRPGNESFFTLCERVVTDSAWPRERAGHCWGDAEIARCSRGEGSPGSAMQWRAYGTNHHLETVTRRLASRRVP